MEAQEKVLWESHAFFWRYFFWLIFAYIFFTIVLIASILVWILWIIAVIAYGILAIPLILQFIKWKSLFYKITDERIIIRTGILNIHERSIILEKIENFEMKRTLIDRLFNTGDIILYTDGESAEGVLYDVPNILAVEQILTDLLGQGAT
ncbi:MAG: PH domain-containing protein [Candidatus Helarchaeota archaeon]